MSEASRAIALQHAATVHHSSGDTEMVLATAEAFHDFIVGNAGTATQSAEPVKVLEKKKAAPKAAPAKVAPPVVEEYDAQEAIATKEEVGEVIEAMLNANMRKQAVELFAKYKAKSLSGVKPEDYAALKEDADDLLLNA